VIGTTGFDAAGKAAIAAAAERIPIVFAPNMAVGVNVVFRLLDVARCVWGRSLRRRWGGICASARSTAARG
jgi:dihydrodipicolinate reductase